MKKTPVDITNTPSVFDPAKYAPARTNPALYPNLYWVVKDKKGILHIALTYNRGRFYDQDGKLIRNVAWFFTIEV